MNEKVPLNQEATQNEEKPNKWFSIIVGIFIAMAIIVLFVFLFPN